MNIGKSLWQRLVGQKWSGKPSLVACFAFADSLASSVVVFDKACRIVHINTTGRRQLQLSGGQKYFLSNFFAPEESGRLQGYTNQLVREGADCNNKVLMALRTDGTRFPVQLSLQALPNVFEYELFTATVQDISRLKEMELLSLEAEEKLIQVADILPGGLYTVDRKCQITSWNREAERITGYTAAEVIGKPCQLVAQHPCQHACSLYSCDTQKPILENEGTIKTKSGDLRIVLKNMQLLHDIKGHVVGGIESFLDVTDDKRRTIELIQAKNRAEESDRLKSAFLANMSHEIRTPINGILGFAELLREPALSPDEKLEFLDIIRNNGKQLLGIINDIVDLSKIEANQLQIKSELVDLHALLTDLYKFFSFDLQLKEKAVELIKEYGSAEPFLIKADSVRLRQIMVNLLANAVKFTDTGSIRFGYMVTNTSIRFYVTDTGVGIHPSQKVTIFDRFVQAENATSRKVKGTGLGLAISKGLVELMGGRIGVESVAGAGSEFYFTLPKMVEMSTSHNLQKPAEDMNYDWANKTILIAEDDNINFKYLEILLKRTNIRILRAADGEEAVLKFRSNPEIDLVLMDIQMPQIDGYEATQIIKSLRPEVPVIAQTANAMNEDMERCLEVGCDGYISKPIDKHTLLDKINLFIRSEASVAGE